MTFKIVSRTYPECFVKKYTFFWKSYLVSGIPGTPLYQKQHLTRFWPSPGLGLPTTLKNLLRIIRRYRIVFRGENIREEEGKGEERREDVRAEE